jgi:hypothetical protein
MAGLFRAIFSVAIASAVLLSAAMVVYAAVPATAPTPTRVHIAVPEANVSPVGWAASDSSLVYTVPDPPVAKLPPCVSCGDPPFTNFHMRFYRARLHVQGSALTVSKPQVLFTAPKGLDVSLYSSTGGWIVYLTYASYDVQNGKNWRLIAHNIASGKEVLLDSPDMEHLPSVPAGARSDGKTVVWSSWTSAPNGGTSVIRSYDLRTGKRDLLLSGGSPSAWGYGRPVVSGSLVVFERDAYGRGPGDTAKQSSRIMLIDRTTRKVRTLTSGHVFQSEPSISGQVVVWKDGAAGDQGKGVVVYSLRTGGKVQLKAFDAEGPTVAAGRYVVFPYGNRTNEKDERVRLYDTVTHSDLTLFRPNGGWGVGNMVRSGDHMVVFQNGKPTQGTHYLSRITVVRLP